MHGRRLFASGQTNWNRWQIGFEEAVPIPRWECSRNNYWAGCSCRRLLLQRRSWDAAQVLVQTPRSRKIFKVLWWFVSGKLRQSQHLLAEMVDGDLSAVNAIGIAVHNVIKGLRRMKSLYADSATRSSLTPEAAANECLFAPISLYRQATDAGKLNGCPFPKHSLFVLEIGKASQGEGGKPLVFMDGTWSRCPAANWVPAMLEGLWRRATAEKR